MVQLGQMWTGTLCFLTISGLLTVGAIPLPEGLRQKLLGSTTHMAFYIPVEITNYNFTAAMLNAESQEYKDMYKDVCTLFEGVYNCDDCPTNSFYGGVATMTFSPGSVIANAIVVFNSYSINSMVAWVLFQKNVEKAAPKNLQINKDYTTRDIVEPVVVPEPPNTTTPTTTTAIPTTNTTIPMTTTNSTNSSIITTPEAIATGDTVTRTPTTHPTDEITTEVNTSTPATVSDASPAPTGQITENPGNYSVIPTSHGVDPTQDPAVTQTTTANSHGQTDHLSSDPQTSAGGSNNGSNDLVPGWGIALLVLAAVVLLLLIIIFIMMLVQCCCTKTESGHTDTPKDPYYPEKKELPQEALPVYSPQAPMMAPASPKPNASPVMIGDAPKTNKSGFYAVNP